MAFKARMIMDKPYLLFACATAPFALGHVLHTKYSSYGWDSYVGSYKTIEGAQRAFRRLLRKLSCEGKERALDRAHVVDFRTKKIVERMEVEYDDGDNATVVNVTA